MTGSADRAGEFELIAELFAPLAQSAPGAFGLTDDAAVLAPPPGHELVVTTDVVVEGVHFLHDDPPDAIAQKALRVNLSDLAAKGAVPIGYLMALLLPAWPNMVWLKAFARGLANDQSLFGVPLMGGDTSSTPGPVAIAVTAFGSVPVGAMIHRAGARLGDLVFVTGTIGDAGGGLAMFKGEGTSLAPAAREALIARYRLPIPRLALGLSLRGIATAALDVSDGLIADLRHVAALSGVRIVVDAQRIPLSEPLRTLWGEEASARAAVSGDDYEIAFTASPERRDAVFDAGTRAGVAVTEIGRVEQGEGVALLDGSGVELSLPRKGFTHF
jgi:thiamine-monophosphate kinase